MSRKRVDTMADVLVVEDNDMTRQVLCRVASHLGHTVRSASTFYMACKEIESRPPDLVLTDWNLSKGEANNGVDVAHFSLTNNPFTFVVMITGNDISQLKHETKSLPISAYLRKPVDLSDLRSVFSDVLES